MPAERVPMRQVREILRLTFSGDIAGPEIARRLGIAPSTVFIKIANRALVVFIFPESTSELMIDDRKLLVLDHNFALAYADRCFVGALLAQMRRIDVVGELRRCDSSP
jgi:hypothetical protein